MSNPRASRGVVTRPWVTARGRGRTATRLTASRRRNGAFTIGGTPTVETPAPCPARRVGGLRVDAELHRHLPTARARKGLDDDGVPVAANHEAGRIRLQLRSGRLSRRPGIGGPGEPGTRVL